MSRVPRVQLYWVAVNLVRVGREPFGDGEGSSPDHVCLYIFGIRFEVALEEERPLRWGEEVQIFRAAQDADALSEVPPVRLGDERPFR